MISAQFDKSISICDGLFPKKAKENYLLFRANWRGKRLDVSFFINYHGVSWKFNFWWMFFGKWKDIRKLQRKLKAWFMTKKIFWGTLKYVMAKPTYFCSRIAIFHWINTHLCRKFFVNTEATRVNRKILITGGVNLQEAVSTFKINWFWEGFQF